MGKKPRAHRPTKKTHARHVTQLQNCGLVTSSKHLIPLAIYTNKRCYGFYWAFFRGGSCSKRNEDMVLCIVFRNSSIFMKEMNSLMNNNKMFESTKQTVILLYNEVAL